MRVRIEFAPRDLRVGLYWEATDGFRYPNPWFHHDVNLGFVPDRRDPPRATLPGLDPVTRIDVYLCLLPMLPIRLTWFRPREVAGRPDFEWEATTR